MLIARAYTVLDAVVVEVTCHHPGRTEENHLVIREERTGLDCTAASIMKAMASVCETAVYFAMPESATGHRQLLCEVELEWASPSD